MEVLEEFQDRKKLKFIMSKILRSPLRKYGLKFQETGLRSPLQETASPILPRAELQELQIFEIDPYGIGIHWPLLDEDLSVAGLLKIAGREDLAVDSNKIQTGTQAKAS